MKTKRCTRCQLDKPLGDYYRNKNNQWCISCYREVNLSNYHKNPEDCVNRQRQRRRNNPEMSNSYRLRHPEKYKAHTAVSNAVRDGRLIKSDRCESCGNGSRKLHGHHWHGYDEIHLLDVKWLCPMCHKKEDRK